MSYKTGDLKHLAAKDHCEACQVWECDCHDEEYTRRVPTDSRADEDEDGNAVPTKTLGGAWLPHSCDEWVIGGPENIRALIADLKLALKAMERE
jgi:hypothetical protein